MTLASILAATFAGGVLSVVLAAAFSLTLLARWTPRLLAYAVGVLLGVAFLDVLPEAVAGAGAPRALEACLAGVLGFFLLEKAALWRHSHAGDEHAQERKPAGFMILVGNGLHNFVDGAVVAAAFLVGPTLGWTTALGVIAHEIPHEMGDFAVLLDAGYSKRAALFWNAASGASAVAGGVLGYAALERGRAGLPWVLALAAASFLYIAVADLIPELHRRGDVGGAALQVALIGAGVATAALAHAL